MEIGLKVVGFIEIAFGLHHLFWVLRFPDPLIAVFSMLPGSLLTIVVTLVLPITLVGSGLGVILEARKAAFILGLALAGYLVVSGWGAVSQFQFWLDNPEFRGQLSWASFYELLKYGVLFLLFLVLCKRRQPN